MDLFHVPVTWQHCSFNLPPRVLRCCRIYLESVTEWLQLVLMLHCSYAIGVRSKKRYHRLTKCEPPQRSGTAGCEKTKIGFCVAAETSVSFCVSVGTAGRCAALHIRKTLTFICRYMHHQFRSHCCCV